MAVTASTILDTIWGLVLNVLNGLLEFASWADTNQTSIIRGLIVVVTIGVVAAFGGKITKFLGGLFDRILGMIKV